MNTRMQVFVFPLNPKAKTIDFKAPKISFNLSTGFKTLGNRDKYKEGLYGSVWTFDGPYHSHLSLY